MEKSPAQISQMRRRLLDHYDQTGRTLPWRIRPEDRARGVTPNPYAIWLSEIMLQQTTVAHGTPYWHKFLEAFPTVNDLANADRDRVLTMWAGLGYYARARNLHKCAQLIRDQYNGRFPESEAELLKLPGIGPYTAAAMAAICFDETTNIVDGNVERVISRVFTVETPLPNGKSDIKAFAATLVGPDRPGDYGQALMDLGSNVCTPTSPRCDVCPWGKYCAAYKAGTQTVYPRKLKKAKLPVRYGAVFVLMADEHVLLERRPDKGLLGGMMGFPGSDWGETPDSPVSHAPMKAQWTKCADIVQHVFTHFELRLDVYIADIKRRNDIDGVWAPLSEIGSYALPTVMKKVMKAALGTPPS